MKEVLVLMGGRSGEREVSLRSGAAVAAALKQAGYGVNTYDPADSMGILLDRAKDADAVFPALHGAGGEDGTLQVMLEAHGLPFVGSDSASSTLCFDKWSYKRFLLDNDLPTPGGALVDKDSFTASEFAKKPYVLKPLKGGSSIDTFIVRDPLAANNRAILHALERYEHMLIEELIDGTEITMSILGDKALPVIEIIPPQNQEFDYENKYNGATQELCPPQHVDTEVQKQAQDLAMAIHAQTGCRGMSRTDMIIDSQSSLWVLETNTIPGLTDQSLYPKAAAAAGISMPELTDRLVRSALGRESRG